LRSGYFDQKTVNAIKLGFSMPEHETVLGRPFRPLCCSTRGRVFDQSKFSAHNRKKTVQIW